MEVSGKPRAQAASPPDPLDKRLGEPQSWSGRCENEKNLPLPGFERQQSVAIPTELSSRLLFLIVFLFFFALQFLNAFFCFTVVSLFAVLA
jgi:hypothetical protein